MAKPLLKIAWRDGPEYPMGIQEPVVGVLKGQLISAGGFTRNPKDVVKQFPDAFSGGPHGFTKLTFLLDLARAGAAWTRIADFPGSARQGCAMAVVDDALYAIGGFNYTAPFTYRDVYRLRQREGKWAWEKLPCDLPWPLCKAGSAVIGTKVYLVGGADYCQPTGARDTDFHAQTGREGQAVGRALLELDITDLKAGWRRLPDHPGLAQFNCAVGAAGGKIYLLGGVFSDFSKGNPAPDEDAHYYNTMEIWEYTVSTKTWKRLRDIPDSGSRGAISYKDRYVILVGQYNYGKTWRLDGKQIERKKPVRFEKTVLVYDSHTDQLGSVDPLLYQTAWPTLAIFGDTIFCTGGEGGRGHHSADLQIGKLTEP